MKITRGVALGMVLKFTCSRFLNSFFRFICTAKMSYTGELFALSEKNVSFSDDAFRDLAARNILLTSSLDPKLSGTSLFALLQLTINGDFGMSRFMTSGTSRTTLNNVGPLKYSFYKPCNRQY